VTPFTIPTPDGQTLYAWHILPIDAYLRNEKALSETARPRGPVEDFTTTLPFSLLSSTSPPGRVVINCKILSFPFDGRISLTAPSPRQRWSCRSRLANRYVSKSDSAAQHARRNHRLPRLRPLHWLSHRSRSNRRRHRPRKLGNTRRRDPTGAHRPPRPEPRDGSLKRRRTEFRRPVS
jgi:hypothetical protein